MRIDLWIGKKCEYIFVLFECLPKGDLSREGIFNNRLDRVTCSGDISQSFFPGSPVIPCGLMNKVATVVVMEVMSRLTNMDFNSPGLLGWGQFWVLAAETNTESLKRHHSPGWWASYLGAGWLHWTTDSLLFILEQTSILGTDMPFVHTMLLQNYYPWTYRMLLSTVMVFHTALLLIKELSSHQKKWGNGPML